MLRVVKVREAEGQKEQIKSFKVSVERDGSAGQQEPIASRST